MMPTDAFSDHDRFPLLTPTSDARLRGMWQHPHAPQFNHRCGDRLTESGLARVRQFEDQLAAAGQPGRSAAAPDQIPPWVIEYARTAQVSVPFYRNRARQHGVDPAEFARLPTCDRNDLGQAPWSFVPDDAPLDDLIVYDTSGTTGHPVFIPSHPVVSNMYLPLLKGVLARHGVTLEGGDRTSIVLVCAQNLTYTFASVSAYLDGAGYIKLNLSPHAWRDPDDRWAFLAAYPPEIYTGDPLSFMELAKLPLKRRPKALVSTSMTLLPGLRAELAGRFQCPVIDVYSMTECRLIAASAPSGVEPAAAAARLELAAHDVFVEILAPDGTRLPPGARGEIALTGGRNPFLALVRYRTGDYGALDFSGQRPALIGLEGRPPTRFLAPGGRIVNNIDVSLALRELPLAQFWLHQSADGGLLLRCRNADRHGADVRRQLRELFGAEANLDVEELEDAGAGRKVVQYTSDIPDAALDAGERSYQDVTWRGQKRP